MKKVIYLTHMLKEKLMWLFFLTAFVFGSFLSYGQTTVTIGSGTNTGYLIPANSNYGYTYSQQIVLQSEIGFAGDITKIRFYMVGGISLSSTNDWTIYVGHTTKSTFSSTTDWEPLANLTQVYTGIIAATPVAGWYEFTFSTPFSYNNVDNLVVAVDENAAGYNLSTNYVRIWTTPVANRAIHYRSDGTNPDPASPPTATARLTYMNQMQFDILQPPCSGMPTPGNTIVSTTPVCFGSTTNFSLQTQTSGDGVTYQWQSSPDGTTWTNVGTSLNVYSEAITAAKLYQCQVTCTNSAESATSTPVQVNVIQSASPYAEPFATTTLPNCWTNTGCLIGSTRGVTGNPGNNIYKNLYSTAVTGNFKTGLIGPINAGDVLIFDYKTANYSSPYDAPAAGSGNFVVAVSTDGTSFTDLGTVSNDGISGWKSKNYDLSAYVGQSIVCRFTGTWISGDYDLAFDNIEIKALSSANDILTFTLTEQTGPATIDAINHTVAIEVGSAVNLNGLIPTITVSPFATINPLSGVAQDFTAPFNYVVTAQNSDAQTWTVTVTNALSASSDKDILTFVIPEATGAATIGANTVDVEVAWTASLSNLTPAITTSPLSTINPLSGAAQDFTSPITYTVTAEDASTKDYLVTVTQQATPAGATCAAAANYGFVNDPAETGVIATSGAFYWYYVTLPTPMANVVFSLCGSDYDSQIEVWGNCADATYLLYNDDECLSQSEVSSALLSAGTYYVKVFAYGSNTGNYELLITGSSCEAPSAVAASNITTATADITWTASVLGETSWNVKVSTISIDPTTGTGDIFDDIVNTTPAQALAGLTEATNYYVYVQSSCGSTWTTEYMFTTLASCPAPIDLVANPGSDNVDLSWNALTGTAWNLKVSSVVIDPSTVAGDMFDGAATNGINVTGLAPQTTYYFYVQTDCGAGVTSAWSIQGTFTTQCAAISAFPWTENFEAITVPAIPSCWTQNNFNADGDFWQTWATYGVSSSNAVGLYTDYNAGANDDYLILPQFTLSGNQRLKYFVRARSTSEPNDYRVVLSTTGNAPADFTTELLPLTTVSSTTMTEISPIDLSAYTGDVYIAIHVPAGGLDGWYIFFDNFTVEDIPACLEPTALACTSYTSTTATITWTASVSAPANGYDYFVSTSTTAPDGATVPTGSVAAGITTADLSSLAANTTYYFWVRANCDGVNYSTWAGYSSFYTGYCIPSAISVDGTGITNVTFGSAPNIVNNTTGVETNNYGDYSAMIGDIQQLAISNIAITFNTSIYDYNTKIWIDLNDDLDFDDAGENVYTGLSSSTSPNTLNASVTIPGTASLGNHRMRIGAGDDAAPTACTTGASYTCFEDYTINVTTPPTCPAPTALFVNNITSTTATLNWTENGSAVLWNLKASTSIFDPATEPGMFPPTSTGSNPFNIAGGLAPNTTYYWFIQSDCGGDVSTWTGGSFTTECGDVTIFPYTENFDGDWNTWCWDVIDNDTDGDTWVQDDAYITPHSGLWTAHGMGNQNDYLITPHLVLADNYMLTWWDVVESTSYNNTYEVLVSTTDKNTASFVNNLGTIDCINEDWVQHTIDLSAYNGQNIYVAFHQIYSDSDWMGFGIDDVVIRTLSNENDILTFSFTQQTGAAVIDDVNHTVAIEVALGTDPNGIVPTFTISDYATVDFASGVGRDFTGPVTYTVTSEMGTPQIWTVNTTVATVQSTENDILTFTLPTQTGPATIDALNHTVAIEVAWNTVLTSLTPTITISPLASINPLSGTAQNFSAPFTYTVTAEDITYIQDWIVTVTNAAIPAGATCANAIDYGTVNDPQMNGTMTNYSYAWYTFTTTGIYENVDIHSCGSAFDTKIAVFNDCGDVVTLPEYNVTPAGSIGFNDDSDNAYCSVDNNQSLVEFATLNPGTYYVVVYPYSTGTSVGNYSIEIIGTLFSEPTIDIIDVNSDVQDIEVCQGTVEGTAIGALAQQITISDSEATEYNVFLAWTIAGYDENIPGDYTATGTFTLPAGVIQTDPVTPLEVTAIVTVAAPAPAVFSFNTTYCVGAVADALPALSDDGKTGTWDIATISTATAGSTDYTFTPDAGQCAVATVIAVTVNDIMTPTFTFGTTYCVGAVADLLPASSVEGITGTWDIATINTAVAGTSDYTFTPDAGQCAVAAVVAVTINDPIAPTFSFDTEYCVGDVADVLPATSDNGFTGTWDIATISTAAAGNVDYTFTPDAGECAIPAIISVTVNDLPVVTCPADFEVTTTDIVVLSGALPIGGEYTGANVTLGEFDPYGLVNGPYTITYTYTDIATGCSSFCEFIITLNIPYPEIDVIDVNSDVADISVCATTLEADAIALLANEITISDAAANEHLVPVTWTIASYDENTAGDYNATGTFVLPFNVSQTDPATTLEVYAVVTVIANTVPAFTVENIYCAGATADVLPLTSDNGVTGTWAPATIDTNIEGATDYVFTPDGAICATPVTISVTVNPILTPAFSFETTYCIGATADVLPLTSDNGVTGTWDIVTISTAAAGTVDYTFTPDAGQCADAAVVAVTVNDVVTPTFSFATEYCFGETADLLPLTSDNGITGTWMPAVINTTTSGNTDYTFTEDAGQCATGLVVPVTVNNLPVVTCPAAMIIAVDAPVAFTGQSPVGGVFTGTGVVGNNFDPNGLADGEYIVTYTYTDGTTGCTNFCDFVVNVDLVNSIITPENATISVYPNPNNGQFTLNFSNVNGEVNYQIYDTKGSIVVEENIMTSGNTVKEVSLVLVPGVYYVKLITNTQTVVEKLVIE